VPSAGYNAWTGPRRARIQELFTVHQTVGGAGRGRRWGTDQINNALVLRLAAEFQGYARDLHDLGVDHFVTVIAGGNQALSTVLRVRLTDGRLLDRGNANPGSLGNDFQRVGLLLWPALESVDARVSAWNKSLEALNAARNAIAHADEAKLAQLRAEGYPIVLKTVRSWHATLDSLAVAMDDVVSAYLAKLLGGGRPW
jgi:hypothetical protein